MRAVDKKICQSPKILNQLDTNGIDKNSLELNPLS